MYWEDDEDDEILEAESLDELLDALTLEEQKRILHDRGFAAPGGKDRRTSLLGELLEDGDLEARDVTRRLLRDKLEYLADLLGVSSDHNVPELRIHVARSMSKKFLSKGSTDDHIPPPPSRPATSRRPEPSWAAPPHSHGQSSYIPVGEPITAGNAAMLMRQYRQLVNLATHPGTPEREREAAMRAAQKIRSRLMDAGHWPADV